MNLSEYSVEMYCPVCGKNKFKFDTEIDYDSDDMNQVIECAVCGKKMKKQQLIDSNRDSIDSTCEEIADNAIKDISKSFKDIKIKIG